MATGSLQVNRDIILATRKQYLAERKHVTPMDAIMALAAMQHRPPYVLNTATDGEQVTVIGQIRLAETYDPVLAALRYVRAGVDAVSFYTDHTIYTKDLDDLLMVSRGVKKIPVIFQNYIFDEYGVISARASGAAALFGYSAVLSPQVLRRVISMTQRYKMTSILQINSMAHLETIYELSPHVVSIGDPESANVSMALKMLKEYQAHIPHYCRTMISNTLYTLEEVKMAVEAGVHAVVVSDEVYSTQAKIDEMKSIVIRDNPYDEDGE
jgi:indole-3-glycerol phosphate synthase